MLSPRAPPLLFRPHRRHRRSPAVRVSSGDGGGEGGFISAVEKALVSEVAEEKGAEHDGRGRSPGALELRWPLWEGLVELYAMLLSARPSR